jgi:hypothetical protein
MLSNYVAVGRGGWRVATVLGVAAIAVGVSMPASMAATMPPDPNLLGISVESYATYDRVILDVSSIPGYTVDPTDVLIGDGSGKDYTLPGSNTYLNVELNRAEVEGFSGPTEVITADPEVKAVRLMSAFEAYVQVGIGLDHVSSYTVTALSPTELVIDVAH